MSCFFVSQGANVPGQNGVVGGLNVLLVEPLGFFVIESCAAFGDFFERLVVFKYFLDITASSLVNFIEPRSKVLTQ